MNQDTIRQDITNRSRLRSWLCAASIGALALAVAPLHAEDAATPPSPSSDGNAAPSQKAKQDPALAAIDQFIAAQKIDRTLEGWKRRLPKPPKLAFDAETTYYWEMDTSEGKMTFSLLPKVAPMHVSSTIYLTRLGFYDNIVFHRIIPGFMAQGGDPTGTGRNGPGYKYAGEFSPSVKHDRPGLLSMANAGPGTDGSQFFITFVETPHLDGRHTIFGRIRAGKDVLPKLEKLGTSPSGRTSQRVEILSARIRTE